jgi:cell division protein FtsI/penicillin-binding protein 2
MKVGALWFRAGVSGVFILTLFGALSARVVHLQGGDHDAKRAKYQEMVSFRMELLGGRGRILDCNGRVLARDEARKNVAVDPAFLHRHGNPAQLQAALLRFLHTPPAMIGTQLADSERRFQYLEKFVDDRRAESMMDYLRENALHKGVVLESVNTRAYPHGNLMSHVVGFANREGVGSAGVEQEMNRYLQGRGGLRVGEKDGHRQERVSRRRVQIDPETGADVTLSLDQYLQHGVEEALERGMKDSNSKAGWAVIMDVKTGAILAMASKPDFNPNQFNTSDEELRRNQALAMVYEPGSVMKPIVFAAALNEGLVNPAEIINCEHGVWIYRGRPIRDFHAYAALSAADVLKKSSNIGTAKIALRLSSDVFHDYMRKFGFGSKTGIDLPGEEAGIFHSVRNWDGLMHSRISYGHSISVTALQMTQAMNVLANDGRMVHPWIVKEIRSPSGEILFQREEAEAGEQVVSVAAARKTRELLAAVTMPGGTGRRAAVEGYTVGGKTGTAEKIVNGQYSSTKNIVSFVGFIPAEKPALTILVSLDEPTGAVRTAGVVAAPVFKEVAEYAVAYLAIPPEGP